MTSPAVLDLGPQPNYPRPARPVLEPRQPHIPMVPESIAQTGLSPTSIEQLILKMLHSRGEIIGRELSNSLGLKFSLIDELMERLKRYQLVQVKRSLGMGNFTSYFTLS